MERFLSRQSRPLLIPLAGFIGRAPINHKLRNVLKFTVR
jgi:hypothetical protein